jgi:truncated hemoglobin YjbI
MTLFYEKAITDDTLAPFFILELGEDMKDKEWIEHIELLADFWLAKLMGEKTYIGNFVGAHVKMPHIQRDSITRWLELFTLSVDEVYVPDVASRFKKRAKQLSQEFINSKKKI